jgi:hypothetical protein
MEVKVKRITFLFIAVLLTGSLYAQDRSDRQREVTPVTIEGILKLERGIVAVESGDTVYFVPILTRYIGFIDELKEGEMISVEGFEFRNIIHPTEITIGGKSYDFPSLSRTSGFRNYFERRRDNERPERNNRSRTGKPA